MTNTRWDLTVGGRPPTRLAAGFVAVLALLPALAAAGDDGPEPRRTFVDLQPSCNHLLEDDFDNLLGNNLRTLPQGEQRLGGTKFKIGMGMIRLRGNAGEELPEKVEGIEVRARAGRLVFLHGTAFRVDDDPQNEGDEAAREIGAYVVHYADKTEERFPIVYGRDLMDWWGYAGAAAPKKAKIAWKGTNAATADFAPGTIIRLFSVPWTNPHPGKEIATFDFVSKKTMCQPFLVALTIEPPPGPEDKNDGAQDKAEKK